MSKWCRLFFKRLHTMLRINDHIIIEVLFSGGTLTRGNNSAFNDIIRPVKLVWSTRIQFRLKDYPNAHFCKTRRLTPNRLEILTMCLLLLTAMPLCFVLPYLSSSLPSASMRRPMMRKWARLEREYRSISRWNGGLFVSLLSRSFRTWGSKNLPGWKLKTMLLVGTYRWQK